MTTTKKKQERSTTLKLSEPDIVIGIDPSSGAKSAVGVSIINPKAREILDFTEIICPKYMPVEKRLKLISKELRSFLYPKYITGKLLIAIEYTIMAGKGGESLNRAIGAMIVSTPVDSEDALYRNVQNTTVKKLIAGHGAAEKEQVAIGLKNFFNSSEQSLSILNDLTRLQKFDIIDSIGIGVTGYLQHISGASEPGDSKVFKPKRKTAGLYKGNKNDGAE